MVCFSQVTSGDLWSQPNYSQPGQSTLRSWDNSALRMQTIWSDLLAGNCHSLPAGCFAAFLSDENAALDYNSDLFAGITAIYTKWFYHNHYDDFFALSDAALTFQGRMAFGPFRLLALSELVGMLSAKEAAPSLHFYFFHSAWVKLQSFPISSTNVFIT